MVSKATEKCKHRYKFYVCDKNNRRSHRATMCCSKRWGMFLADMKCVGMEHANCPFVHPEKTTWND